MPSSSYSATYFLIISWPLWYPFLFLETSLLHIHTHPFISTSGLYPPLACVSDNCTVTRFVPFAITPITQRKWSNCIKDQKLIIVGSTGVSAIAASTGYFDKSRHRRLVALTGPLQLALLTWTHPSIHSSTTIGNIFPLILRTVAVRSRDIVWYMWWVSIVRGFYEASLPFIVGSWDFQVLFFLFLLTISTLFLIYIARRLIDSEKNCQSCIL